MSKRIRSRQSAQIDRTNGQNDVIESTGNAPLESKQVATGEVTETCMVTIAAPEKPWECLSRLYNAYAGLYAPGNNPFEGKGTVKPAQKREGTTNANAGQGTRRYEWKGFAVTAILRWMGNRGIKAKAAGTALAKIGLADVSHATVQTQIQAGRKDGAKLPELTEEQANELLAAAA